MFQYAFGRAMAEDWKIPLLYDLRQLKVDKLRTFALEGFHHAGKEANAEVLRRVSSGVWEKVWSRLRLPGNLNRNVVSEKGFGFQSKVLEQKAPKYFMGYWQTEKYFVRHSEVIRHDFEFTEEITKPVSRLSAVIGGTESIAVHIRRGDYVANPHTNSYHGVCSPEYYQRALAAAMNGLAMPQIYVFTDDPSWVADNMKWPAPSQILSGTGLNDWQEMYLMSQCRSIITANSSFSWWAAWLSGHNSVLVPAKWFSGANHSTDDLIPNRWTRI